MGNEASTASRKSDDALMDEVIRVDARKKSVPNFKAETTSTISISKPSHSTTTLVESETIEQRENNLRDKRGFIDESIGAKVGIHEEELIEDIDPMEILFQFIPYYGQGDPSNDSLVSNYIFRI